VNALNNTLTFQIWSTAASPATLTATLRLTIPVGYYTMPELVQFLEVNMNLLASPFTGVPTSFQMLISGAGTSAAVAGIVTIMNPVLQISFMTSGPTFPYAFAIQPFNFPVQAGNTFPPLLDDVTNMLGITPTKTGVQFYNLLEGGYASMLYTPYFDVVSTTLTKNQKVQDGSSGKFTTTAKLARVYLANEAITERIVTITYGSGGSSAFFTESSDSAIGCSGPLAFRREFRTPKYISWNASENIDTVDLQMLDSRGNLLPIEQSVGIQANSSFPSINDVIFSNTADFQFSLQVSET